MFETGFHDFLGGTGAGLAGGLTSGLLGVSPGGGLVVFSVMLLGVEQHVAQGISLAAQIPPTSLSGIKYYRENGSRSPLRWLVMLAMGCLGGGVVGALLANFASSITLQWAYVAYLVVLDAMLVVRGRRPGGKHDSAKVAHDPHSAGLFIVGLFAGLSSGFLGIGGGLATVVGLNAVLGVPQHQAQMISLVLSLVPTTLPSAWMYWSSGSSASWPTLVGVIFGLFTGTGLGALAANRINHSTLHAAMVFFVSLIAIYMAVKALTLV